MSDCEHVWFRSSVVQRFMPEYKNNGFFRRSTFITWHFLRIESYYCQKCTEPKIVSHDATGDSTPEWWSDVDPCSGEMRSGYKLPDGIYGI